MAKDESFFPEFGDFSLEDTPAMVQPPAAEPVSVRPESGVKDSHAAREQTTRRIRPEEAHSRPSPDAESTKKLRKPDLDRLIDSMGGLDEKIPNLFDEKEAATVRFSHRLVSQVMEEAEAPRSRILGANEKPEDDEEELEARFIRRVAAREASRNAEDKHRSRRRKGDDTPDDGAEEAREDELPGEEPVTGKSRRRSSAFMESLKGPFVRYFATLTAQKALRAQEAASWPAPVVIRDTPELSPAKAARYYAGQYKTLSLRLFISLFLSLVLVWISLDLPMAGPLAQNMSLRAAVCLVCLLAVMVAALDILTAGIRQICRMRLGMEALATVSCMICCADAVLSMLGLTAPLPYCVLGAVSLTAALWGERLLCLANAMNFSTAASAKTSSILSAEEGNAETPATLLRRDGPHEGIVRRSEEPDISREAYTVAAPLLLLAAAALAVIGTIGSPWLSLVHRLSAYLCLCSSFSSFLCFCLPYLTAVVRLRRTGAAIAGWAGCEDMGRSRRVIVTDEDMFPKGTIQLTGVNILDGSNVEKVVSYTVSLLAASGSSVTAAFDELMKHRKYQTLKVEEFKCHDGGGLSAYIRSENVRVGSAGFMNLMGIRLPHGLVADNAICVAISNELVGVFSMKYVPVKGVRQALNILTQGRTQPVFAIRDFNITPLMIQDLFRIPAINFEFPSFRERYRLSASYGSENPPTAAILLRSGIRCAVETAERGRKLYAGTIVSTVLSIAGSALGLFLLYLIGRSGGDSLSAGRLLGYMLLWILPVFGVSYWVYR